MKAADTRADQNLFKRNWVTYRKMVDQNYLFHREAYATLRTVLQREAPRGFHFLDIACGDAKESVAVLARLPVGHYHGIDFSAAALDLAEGTLRRHLACSFELTEADYVAALQRMTERYHVAWVGLSLHHLPRPEKRSVLERLRHIVASKHGPGLVLIYENTSPDGETPRGWHTRWDALRPDWTAFDAEEWEAVTGHVHREDHPETVSSWHRLGVEAGFQAVEELYASPTDLFRLFAFRCR